MIDQTSVVPSGAGRTRYTSEAVRTGDVIPAGDAGLKLNELYPQRYPHAAVAVAVSRAQVKAELAEAIRTGDMAAKAITSRSKRAAS